MNAAILVWLSYTQVICNVSASWLFTSWSVRDTVPLSIPPRISLVVGLELGLEFPDVESVKWHAGYSTCRHNPKLTRRGTLLQIIARLNIDSFKWPSFTETMTSTFFYTQSSRRRRRRRRSLRAQAEASMPASWNHFTINYVTKIPHTILHYDFRFPAAVL